MIPLKMVSIFQELVVGWLLLFNNAQLPLISVLTATFIVAAGTAAFAVAATAR